MVDKAFHTRIELYLNGMDFASPDNTLCVISFLDQKAGRYIDCDRTDLALDKVNPQWTRPAVLNYFFEGRQELRISVEDRNLTSLAYFDTNLASLICKGTTVINLVGEGFTGTLQICAKEVKSANQLIMLHLRAHNVDKMDLFGKSDPYFILYKQNQKHEWIVVYKSEIIKNTLDPNWKPFELNSSDLSDGNNYLPLKIECWDWDNMSKDDFIGQCELTFPQLSTSNSRFELINPAKLKKGNKKYSNSGVLEIVRVQIKNSLSFVDFLQSGGEVGLGIAIDFTTSNGDFQVRNSLHYSGPDFQNEYERAIITIGGVLEAYDKDKMFAVFGFGGEPKWSRRVEHCFALNRDNENPFISTIEGVLTSYRQALPQIKLSGPTLFQFILSTANSIAQSSRPGEAYTLFLILTDGEIHDLNRTITAIVESSFLPISVIIIGVGLENFTNISSLMTFPLVDENGRRSARNNVIFAPFRNFGGNPYLLANYVLKAIPQHVVQYLELIG